jgi:lipoate-protein ligase A
MSHREKAPAPGLPLVVVDRGRTGTVSVREDARLLAAGRPGVRVAVLSDRSVSVGVGVSGRPPYLERAAREGLTVVRRDTGGTAILHGPGDLAWSIVLPRSDLRVGRDFVHAYARLGGGVLLWLRSHGVAGAWGSPPSLFEEYCLLSGRGQVLRVGDRVAGGAAQHATAAALLHHGILPYAVDRDLLSRLFGLPDPGAAAQLCGLTDLGIRDPPERLAEELARGLEAFLANG